MYNFGVVMTDEEKKLLSTFEARLRHLIYLHDELKRENAELKQLLEAKEEECEKVRADYKELETNYTNLKTATTISLNGSDVKETKLRLSKLVREVDKCIALLNEEKRGCMNDKIKINLQMAGATYPLTINREDEEIVREAAKQVNIRINAYREHYQNISSERIIAMVAYQFALETLQLKDRNDTEPYTAKIKELTEVLESYFKER